MSEGHLLRWLALGALAAIAGFACAFAIARGARTEAPTHDAATLRTGHVPHVSAHLPAGRSFPRLRTGGAPASGTGTESTPTTATSPTAPGPAPAPGGGAQHGRRAQTGQTDEPTTSTQEVRTQPSTDESSPRVPTGP